MTGFLRIVYSAFTIVFLATTLQANSTIVPVIVDVEASGRGVVEITNLRTQPTLYNIEVLKWAVVDGVDEYEDTRLFIVSPPSFKLHPGKSKKVRLGFRGKRGTPSEQTFRLIVAEVPSEVKKAAEGTSTLDVTLRHVLPVYVAPQTPGGPKLRWTITTQGDTAALRATNSGNQRANVVSVGLHPNPNQENTPVYANNSLAHVLAGSWREWQVKLPEGMLPGKAVYKLTGLNQTYQLANHE